MCDGRWLLLRVQLVALSRTVAIIETNRANSGAANHRAPVGPPQKGSHTSYIRNDDLTVVRHGSACP